MLHPTWQPTNKVFVVESLRDPAPLESYLTMRRCPRMTIPRTTQGVTSKVLRSGLGLCVETRQGKEGNANCPSSRCAVYAKSARRQAWWCWWVSLDKSHTRREWGARCGMVSFASVHRPARRFGRGSCRGRFLCNPLLETQRSGFRDKWAEMDVKYKALLLSRWANSPTGVTQLKISEVPNDDHPMFSRSGGNRIVPCI